MWQFCKGTYTLFYCVSDHSGCYWSIIKNEACICWESVFPLIFSVTLFHSRVSWCQPPASKQPLHLLKILLTHIKAHSCLENICSFSLNFVLQFLQRKWIVLHFFFPCAQNSCVVPNFPIKLWIADTGA